MLLRRKHQRLPFTSAAFNGRLTSQVPVETLDYTRNIGLSLLRSFADQPSYVLGITGAHPGEGKTTIGLGLTEVMATDLGLNVLLIDAHAERPWTERDSAFADRPGLSDWLGGTSTLDDSLMEVHERCSVMPFGTQPITSRDVLQYLTKRDAFTPLRERFSLIMLDLPELLNPAAPALTNLCDGTVLVIRAGATSIDAVKDYLPVLQNVTLHGVVLNRHRSRIPALLRRAFG